MVISYAIDDGPVIVLDLTAGDRVGEFYDAVRDADRIVMHNSAFDRTILRKLGQLEIAPEKIHDTMANAMAHGLPGGLDKLCGIFRVPEALAKHKGGKDYIRMFCVPQPKNTKLRRKTRDTHPQEWQEFLDYAGGDIHSMRYLYRKMPRWSFFDNPDEHALWCRDQRINDRGFGVDIELAEAAERAVADEKVRLKDRTQELTEYDPDEGTGVESATKRDQLLRHVLAEYGVTLPDLRAGTLERRIDDPDIPEPLKELLRVRLMASSASSAKYKKLLQVISNGRVRGALQFCGAVASQRWSGRLFQPQNLPRPTWGNDLIEAFIGAVKAGCEDLISDNVMKGLANALRGLIVARPGTKLVVADLANIEGRVLAWLAGEEWKLQAFRDYDDGVGPDLYLVSFSKCFGVPIEQVTKDQRQLGKVSELALGFQGAVGAFAKMAQLYGLELSEAEIKRVVAAWRDANENIRSFWRDLEEAWREAVLNPGLEVHCRKVTLQKKGAWLRIKLPSQRGYLTYASPGVDGGKCFYWGQNPYTRRWEKISTYGGKIANNLTQRVSRDILASNIGPAEDAGYEIGLLVHDELVTEAPDLDSYSVEELTNILATKPDWPDIEDLPLAAAGFEGYRYRKD